MILELDMGNTRIKWRLRSDSGKVTRGNLVATAPYEALANAVKAAAVDLDGEPISRVLVASVLGEECNLELCCWSRKHFAIAAEFAHSVARAEIVANGYIDPGALGVDRWLAVIAAYSIAQRACLVVDCGSAITVDLISDNGRHLGGYIAPGLQLMRSALLHKTRGVQIGCEPAPFALAPGRDTEACVTAAQSAMIAGLVEQALRQLLEDSDGEPALIFTGGDANWLRAHFPAACVRPDLVFDGLALALPSN